MSASSSVLPSINHNEAEILEAFGRDAGLWIRQIQVHNCLDNPDEAIQTEKKMLDSTEYLSDEDLDHFDIEKEIYDQKFPLNSFTLIQNNLPIELYETMTPGFGVIIYMSRKIRLWTSNFGSLSSGSTVKCDEKRLFPCDQKFQLYYSTTKDILKHYRELIQERNKREKNQDDLNYNEGMIRYQKRDIVAFYSHPEMISHCLKFRNLLNLNILPIFNYIPGQLLTLKPLQQEFTSSLNAENSASFFNSAKRNGAAAFQKYHDFLDSGQIKEAQDALTEAAEKGYPLAQVVLGTNYAAGKNGYPKNIDLAIKWLNQAVLTNDKTKDVEIGAHYNLAIIYETEKHDVKKSLIHYEQAKLSGYSKASEEISRVNKMLEAKEGSAIVSAKVRLDPHH